METVFCDNCDRPIFFDDTYEDEDGCGYCSVCDQDIESCDCTWCVCYLNPNEVCLIEEEE